MITIKDIIQKATTYLPSLDAERIARAYDFADRAHSGQKRFSGEPYITHPLNVANILLEFHPDEDTIVSALLHDVVEDTSQTLDEIEKHFGPCVRSLCWGMEKLSKVRSKLDDPQIENLRKLFLAMAKDFRVVLLKLCDRSHNMQTLSHVRPEKRRRIAQETLNIYAPIAARLGIYHLKSQLEDLCFEQLYPEDFQSIKSQLEKTGKWREKYIDVAQQILNETLTREGLHGRVDGRVKSSYSIYRKLQKKGKTSLSDIFDVFAMRIILPDIYKHGNEYTGHIYTALGILHNSFTPLANRFKDYVAVPKVNGYRSLHTAVMGLGPKVHTQPTEVQIRTEAMHQAAEFGIAAHWLYEEADGDGGSAKDESSRSLRNAVAKSAAPIFEQHKEWISGLSKIEKEIKGNTEFLEHLQVDIFQDRIFVLTPRGDVKDLPRGATAIDFAYAVHTEIGHHCIGAKVNGSIVPLDCVLKSGEVIEVVTRKNAKPSQSWLTFTKTTHARNRIRAWFRDLDETKHLRDGKAMLNEKLRQLGKPILDDNLSLLRKYEGGTLSVREREELLIEIGKGAAFPGVVIRKIFTMEELMAGREQNRQDRPGTPPITLVREARPGALKAPVVAPQLTIGGAENTPYQFVKCCNATAHDELVGYVTRGRGISVHKKDCLMVKNVESSRLITVCPADSNASSIHYPVHVRILAEDRVGLVRDVTKAISENTINILDVFRSHFENGSGEMNFILEIENFDQLERVLSNLEKIPSVRRAVRVN